MLHDVASGTLLAAKMEWEAAGRGETDQRAITRLQQQLRCLRPASSAEGGGGRRGRCARTTSAC